jgi:hypothetical protein
MRCAFRWGSFGDDGYEELDAWVAFRLGLKTWANWVDANIDPNATRVFFDLHHAHEVAMQLSISMK